MLGPREETVGASLSPAARKVVPELSAGRFSMAGRIPPLWENEARAGFNSPNSGGTAETFSPWIPGWDLGCFLFFGPKKEALMSESLYPFVNKTVYDRRALMALNDLAEKSVRKEKSRITRLLCYVLGLVGLVAGAFLHEASPMISNLLLLYGVLLLLMGFSWKSFQLRSSQRQLQRGMKECTYEFDDDEIICTTEAGEQRYAYEQVFAVVSDKDWYVLFFDAGHGVIIDRKGFIAGDDLSFKSFIGQHTQLPIQEF